MGDRNFFIFKQYPRIEPFLVKVASMGTMEQPIDAEFIYNSSSEFLHACFHCIGQIKSDIQVFRFNTKKHQVRREFICQHGSSE